MRYILSILFFILFTNIANAQVSEPSAFISVQPENPLPGENVVVTLNSSNIDLDKASILWRANGKTVESGLGKKSISIAAPSGGTTGIITATIGTVGFQNIEVSTTIRSGMLDLLWEATESYTPPFYKGKALPSTNSQIKMHAIPALNAPRSMVYTWSKDDTVLGSMSGAGKSSYIFRNSELNNSEKITINGSSGNFNVSTTKIVQIENPTYIVYKKNEGFIDYATGSQNSVSTNQQGIILRIEPFFFSANRNPRILSFSILDNENYNISNSNKPNEIAISGGGATGSMSLNISISSPQIIFQQISKVFNIIFN